MITHVIPSYAPPGYYGIPSVNPEALAELIRQELCGQTITFWSVGTLLRDNPLFSHFPSIGFSFTYEFWRNDLRPRFNECSQCRGVFDQCLYTEHPDYLCNLTVIEEIMEI